MSYRKRRPPRPAPRLTHRKTDTPPNGTNDGAANETGELRTTEHEKKNATGHDRTTRRQRNDERKEITRDGYRGGKRNDGHETAR